MAAGILCLPKLKSGRFVREPQFQGVGACWSESAVSFLFKFFLSWKMELLLSECKGKDSGQSIEVIRDKRTGLDALGWLPRTEARQN